MDLKNSNTGMKFLSSLSPETKEALEHAIMEKGITYDSVENAFEYLNSSETDEYIKAIKNYSEAISQNDKDESIAKIIKILE